MTTDGTAIWVAPIEYVVLRKLEYYRDSGSDRHLRDAAMMLRISREGVDEAELARSVATFELEDLLEEAERFLV